jgi:hypothetical protein
MKVGRSVYAFVRRSHAVTLWNYPFQSEKDMIYFIYLAHGIHSKLIDLFTVTLNVCQQRERFIYCIRSD